MRRLVIIAVFLPLFAQSASDREQVMGLWASEGSIFSVFEKAGLLHGEIIALKDPVYTVEEDSIRAGKTRLDDNNPDESQRTRPIIGLDMFAEYRFDDKQWRGKIYDPESGNHYQSKMVIAKDGRLEIRGYIGIPLFGRTARFDPVASCEEHIVEMLKKMIDPPSNPKTLKSPCPD
jgi:uncharacterized protein (DUF2147 family)